MKNTIVNPTDPRVVKTRARFMNAFKELILLYDDYMEITVKELCDKANLNRKTFYLHYKQVDDLFLELQNEIINAFNKAIAGFNPAKDVEQIVRAYFEINESNPVYQKLNTSPHYIYTKELARKKGAQSFEEKACVETTKHDNLFIRDFYRSFYFYSGYLLYSKWVKSNRPIPKEEAIEITSALIKNGISSLQKNSND